MHGKKQEFICKLFGTNLPIIQAGMVWVSGASLAAASSNAGALGVIGAASMSPQLLRSHIQKAKTLTNKPFAVNVPLLYSRTQEQIEVALEEGVKLIITSAGSPKKHAKLIQQEKCKHMHVVSSPLLALKCQDAGVDAVIAEGFEAGGHNGRDELTTLVLIPQVVKAVDIPVVAAGGIASGEAILAAFALGASAVQIGSRFAATQEASAHDNFKKAIIEASFDATQLCMKSLVPVRLIKNDFYQRVFELERQGASTEDLKKLLGKGRAKLGMFDGNLDEGELEIGQVSGSITDIPYVKDLVERLINEYKIAFQSLQDIN